jgi:hypothetical protein
MRRHEAANLRARAIVASKIAGGRLVGLFLLISSFQAKRLCLYNSELPAPAGLLGIGRMLFLRTDTFRYEKYAWAGPNF